MTQKTEIRCKRCRKPIKSRKNLSVAEVGGTLEPFHYRCFLKESEEANSLLREKCRNVFDPEMERVIRYLPYLKIGTLILALILFAIMLIIGVEFLNSILFTLGLVAVFGVIILLSHWAISKYERRKRESWEKFGSKLPE